MPAGGKKRVRRAQENDLCGVTYDKWMAGETVVAFNVMVIDMWDYKSQVTSSASIIFKGTRLRASGIIRLCCVVWDNNMARWF